MINLNLPSQLFYAVICCFTLNTLYAAEPLKPSRQADRPKDYYGVEVSKLENLNPLVIKKLVEIIITYTQTREENCLPSELSDALAPLREALENRTQAQYEDNQLLTDVRLIALLKNILSVAGTENTLTQLREALGRLPTDHEPRDLFGVIIKLLRAAEARATEVDNQVTNQQINQQVSTTGSSGRRRNRAKKSPAARTPIPSVLPTRAQQILTTQDTRVILLPIALNLASI